MPRTSSVEVLGEIRRAGRIVVVEACEADGQRFVRIRSKRWDGAGRRWSTIQKLSLLADEAQAVAEALRRAMADTPDNPESDRRRRLDKVRQDLKRHERNRGRRWPSGT